MLFVLTCVYVGDCGTVREVTEPYSLPQLHDDFGAEGQVCRMAVTRHEDAPHPSSLCISCPSVAISLGGNCMTSMIATCSVEKGNIDESISTCRFAQRVALIKNDATLNEELDPKLVRTDTSNLLHLEGEKAPCKER